MNNEKSIQESVARMVNARKRMRDLATKKMDHVCSHETCLPLNEPAFLYAGFIAPPIICEFVYLCRYGSVHICTANTCMRYFENKMGVCPISNIQYSSAQQTDYDKEDWRTWYQKPQTNVIQTSSKQSVVTKKRSRKSLLVPGSLVELKEEVKEEVKIEITTTTKKKKQRVINLNVIETRIKETLYIILFSPTRNRFNDEITKQHKTEHRKAQDRYITKCKDGRQIPNLIDLIVINNYYNNLPLPMLKIKMDKIMHEHYTNLILQVWEKVYKYADDTISKINVEAVVLGTLYTLRQGLVVQGIELIPKDTFISQRGVLPLINDIVRFGFTKRKVTCGEKLIDSAYSRALALNVSKDDLMINFSEIIEHTSQQDIVYIPLGKKRPPIPSEWTVAEKST